MAGCCRSRCLGFGRAVRGGAVGCLAESASEAGGGIPGRLFARSDGAHPGRTTGSRPWGSPWWSTTARARVATSRAAQVARATDDHTLGLMINGNMTIAKILNPATPYDPLKDLSPVSLIAVAPLVLTAPASAPEGGAAFLAAAKASGDNWNYGSPGVGTVAHLGMELIKSLAGHVARACALQRQPGCDRRHVGRPDANGACCHLAWRWRR